MDQRRFFHTARGGVKFNEALGPVRDRARVPRDDDGPARAPRPARPAPVLPDRAASANRSRWRLRCSKRSSAARTALTAYLESGASAYGVTTGLGFLADRRARRPSTRRRSSARSWPAGPPALGPPLSEPVVRGAMLLRLTGFLSGHAGRQRRALPLHRRPPERRLVSGRARRSERRRRRDRPARPPVRHARRRRVRARRRPRRPGRGRAGRRRIAALRAGRQGGHRADQRRPAGAGAGRAAPPARRGAARPRDALRRAHDRRSPARHSRPYAPRVGALKGDPGQQADPSPAVVAARSHAGPPPETRARRRSRCA